MEIPEGILRKRQERPLTFFGNFIGVAKRKKFLKKDRISREGMAKIPSWQARPGVPNYLQPN